MDTGDITCDHTDSQIPGTASVDSRVMVVSLVICFAALFIIAFYHLYIRLYLCNSRRGGSDLLPDRRRQSWSHDQTSAAGKGQGLPPEIIKALPTFLYSEAECMECAVCLSEFEDGETGRVLPGCGHWFHVECIDVWFATHSNCPLCRAPVRPVEPISELTSIKIEALGEADGVNRYYSGCFSGSIGPTVEPK